MKAFTKSRCMWECRKDNDEKQYEDGLSQIEKNVLTKTKNKDR